MFVNILYDTIGCQELDCVSLHAHHLLSNLSCHKPQWKPFVHDVIPIRSANNADSLCMWRDDVACNKVYNTQLCQADKYCPEDAWSPV